MVRVRLHNTTGLSAILQLMVIHVIGILTGFLTNQSARLAACLLLPALNACGGSL